MYFHSKSHAPHGVIGWVLHWSEKHLENVTKRPHVIIALCCVAENVGIPSASSYFQPSGVPAHGNLGLLEWTQEADRSSVVVKVGDRSFACGARRDPQAWDNLEPHVPIMHRVNVGQCEYRNR